MAGVGTVIADDPLLTDRSGLPRRRPLLRVLLDSWLRLPSDSRLVKTAQDDVLVNDDIVFTKAAYEAFVAGPARGKAVKASARSSEIAEGSDEQ